VGVLCAAAGWAMGGVDGDGEASFAMGRGGDGHQRDRVGQVGARGVRQDLLNDGGHHSLVVAVPAAKATSGGGPERRKRESGWS
jgi:hypothetical protein